MSVRNPRDKDHGKLTGLTDDDHSQYSLVSGGRPFTGPVGGIAPVSGSDIATKAYVDGVATGLDWQDSVKDRDLATPPGAPATGDRYIVAAGGTGAWTGKDDQIAEWDGTAWVFTVPNEGFAAWAEDENRVVVFNGTSWVVMGSVIDHGALLGLTDDDHSQYPLSAGRSGGQTISGGTSASENVTIQSTSHATKGKVLLGSNSAYDEANGILGIGTQSPTQDIHIKRTVAGTATNLIEGNDDAAVQLKADSDATTGGPHLALINLDRTTGDLDIGPGSTKTIHLDSTAPLDSIHVDDSGDVGLGGVPVATAKFDVSSTTKGALFPRMTTVQRDAIATPATGLLVYNTTTNALNVFDGTSWVAVGSGGAGGGLYDAYAKVSDVKAVGTDGGTFTGSAWQTRDINTEDIDTAGILTIASNQITLQAGTYRVFASAPAFDVDRHILRLQNITDGITEILGTSEQTNRTHLMTTRSFLSGRITVTATKIFEIQHKSLTTSTGAGFGISGGLASNEVYTIAEFFREGSPSGGSTGIVQTAKMNRSAVQSITSSTWTKILLDTEEWDIGGIADPTTNNRFDILQAGKYLVESQVGVVTDNGMWIGTSKNGTRVQTTRANTTRSIEQTTVLDLVPGDFIELEVFQNGATQNTDTTSAVKPRMSVTRIDAGSTAPAAPTGGLTSRQIFTASGTWTKPAGITKVIVELVGGGGGGGSGLFGQKDAFGGGGGGGSKKFIDVTGIASETVTVGTGGAGGTGTGNGATGGTTSFGAHASATGGGGGNGSYGTMAGSGGIGSGGDVNIGGQGGGSTFGTQSGGMGGSSFLGGGGRGAKQDVAAEAGRAFGGGGAGGDNTIGAAGAAGVVIVWEYT